MDIYTDRVRIGSLKNVIWFKKGRFITRLVGVNITQKEEQINVEPVWVPLLAIDTDGDNTFITISTDKPKFLIVLFPRWPFVHAERTDVISLDEE
jgi:hypothetical protein